MVYNRVFCYVIGFVLSAANSSSTTSWFSLRLGHARGKTILNHFLTLSRRFASLACGLGQLGRLLPPLRGPPVSPVGSVTSESDSPPDCHSIPSVSLRYLKDGGYLGFASLPDRGSPKRVERVLGWLSKGAKEKPRTACAVRGNFIYSSLRL